MEQDIEELDCQNLLGYMNQKNVYTTLNITNFMKLEALDIHDLFSSPDQDLNLTRRSLVQTFMMTTVSYFCVGTEIRFLKESGCEEYQESLEDILWHGRSLEMAISFFPGDCSLTKHVRTSYEKHHAPVTSQIPEGSEVNEDIKVLKSLEGVHSNREQPFI